MNKLMLPLVGVLLLATLAACQRASTMDADTAPAPQELLDKYTTVRLTADLSDLTDAQRRMIGLLIEAGQEMDAVFWQQAYGDRDALLEALDDPALRRFAEINYGPWDRLDANRPFVEGAGAKPDGANFYPADMTDEEFEQAAAGDQAFESLYTMIRRDEQGELVAIPYHEHFAERHGRAADLLERAADLAEEPGLKRYLTLRAEALRTDRYLESDLAWMDMKDNVLDVIVGPVETYEDQRYGLKAANETFVLVKDRDWSRRLARYAELLPMLQRGLPVPEAYKQDMPGTDSDLGAYDAIYYAGDANAGSKTIAINLPNDERVQQQKGTRRLQLKNAMRAKFDEILLPISEQLVAEDQRPHVTFDAFFGNTMFHEVAHGLGVQNVITGAGTVREALRDRYTTMEEGKADVLGLYMVTKLHEEGELDVDLMDNYTTFLASIFRSIRFGAASAHGRANLIRFNYFREQDAFTRDEATGTYRVDREAMQQAMNRLSEEILRLQGDGDYEATTAFVERYGRMTPELQADLDRLAEAGIPVDVVFEQGPRVLGLES